MARGLALLATLALTSACDRPSVPRAPKPRATAPTVITEPNPVPPVEQPRPHAVEARDQLEGAFRRFGRLEAPGSDDNDVLITRSFGDEVVAIDHYGGIRRWRRDAPQATPKRVAACPDGCSSDFIDAAWVAASDGDAMDARAEVWVVDAHTGQRRCTTKLLDPGGDGVRIRSFRDGRHFAAIGADKLWILNASCGVVKDHEFRGRLDFGEELHLHRQALRVSVLDPSQLDERWSEEIALHTWRRTRVPGSQRKHDAAWGLWPAFVSFDDDADVATLNLAGAPLKFSNAGRLTFDWMVAAQNTVGVFMLTDGTSGRGFVVDLGSLRLRRRIGVPIDWIDPTIDASGRWLTVGEEHTVLLYDLGPGR